MTFNPEFMPAQNPGELRGALRLYSPVYSLRVCTNHIIDQDEYEEIKLAEECAATYCDLGECVVTEFGAGCTCNEGAAARVFKDSDGLPSITCVPDTGTVDFAAGGLELPDACDGVDVQDGTCIDVGGFANVVCDEGKAAALIEDSPVAQCADIVHEVGDNGARNYSRLLQDIDVCAPPPPSCPEDGWLEDRGDDLERPGVECYDPPDPSWFEKTPEPDCSEQEEDELTDLAAEDASASSTSDSKGSDGADDATSDEDTASGSGGADEDEPVEAGPNTTKPRQDPDEGADEDEEDESKADESDDSEKGADAGKGGVEPSGNSRLFCGVINVGGARGASLLSGLLFAAAALVMRRRRYQS
jgi:hypothetical protein